SRALDRAQAEARASPAGDARTGGPARRHDAGGAHASARPPEEGAGSEKRLSMAKVNATLTIRGPQEFAEAFRVPRETIHRLTRYAERLAHWQKRFNLVCPSALDQNKCRHFANSPQTLS